MTWTIISIHAPSSVVDHSHNYIFRVSEELDFASDSYASKSPSDQSDNGTPAPASLPPDVTLALTTGHFPKDPRVGFVFGTDRDKCDILLPRNPEHAISSRQFAITFQTSSGAVILRNLSRRHTKIVIGTSLETTRLQTQRAMPSGRIAVRFHGLTIELSRPWGDDHVPKIYTTFLATLANAVPNLGAMQLSSAAASSARTSTSNRRSIYGSEVIVGSGASAIVYRASHRQTGDVVAIKRYKEKRATTTWKEGSILCTLSHKHIVTFHHFHVRDGEGAELIMEYAVLGSLLDQMRAMRLTVKEARTTIEHTLLALQYLHDKGITHRDIKPGNILIMDRNPIHAKVADFGISSKADYHDTLCGTARYSAPEICQPPYTAKVDIWYVGVIMMELLGSLPAKSKVSWAEKLVAHKTKQPSNMVTELLDACLQLEPKDRATAKKCLQLPFFDSQTDEAQNQTLLANSLDAEGCATVVRIDSSIPDTAPCDVPENKPPLLLEEQGEEPPPAVSNLGWNVEDLEPFLLHGEGEQIASPPQLQGWTSEDWDRLLSQAETRPELYLNLPLFEEIPTWNPIDVENWIPGGARDVQSDTAATDPVTASDSDK